MNVSTTENSRFSKLKGRENYDTWKISAKSYLVIKKAWSCVTTELVENPSLKQVEADLLAWSELSLLLDETVYSYIADTQTAKDAWDALENAFQDSGLCRKVELLKQLVQLKLADCISTEDYVNRMIMTSLKVKKTGLNIDDEVVASLLLAGLPYEFRSLVMAIENSTAKLTTDAVKTLLLQDTRFSSNINRTGAYVVKSRKQGGFKFRCHKCGELAHMAKDCPGNLRNHGELANMVKDCAGNLRNHSELGHMAKYCPGNSTNQEQNGF